jgi:hypothetical protein
MNSSRAGVHRFLPRRNRRRQHLMENLDKSVECAVVSALEERMWLDRRETPVGLLAGDASGLERLRAKVRVFLLRMQLGPVGGYDPTGERERGDRF